MRQREREIESESERAMGETKSVRGSCGRGSMIEVVGGRRERERGREEGAGGKSEEQISSRGCELLAQHSRNGTGHAKQTAKIPFVGSGSRHREREVEGRRGREECFEEKGRSRERLSEGERGEERISTDIKITV